MLLAANLFGDIISDEAGAVVGSLGLLPSASIGGRGGLFEPVHGSAPDIAGKDIANPIGAIASAALLLRYALQAETEASAVEGAIGEVLTAGWRTADLASTEERPPISCSKMAGAIVEQIRGQVGRLHAGGRMTGYVRREGRECCPVNQKLLGVPRRPGGAGRDQAP